MEIIRTNYIDILWKYSLSRDIKIITGIRRIGKSTLLRQYANFLKQDKNISTNNIITYDFNNQIILGKLTWEVLINSVLTHINKSKEKFYLFIDEVQELKDWQKAIKTLFENGDINIDIYLTGSNSQTLSTDISTWFTGRHININLLPINFNELCESQILKPTANDIRRYLNFGGMGKIVPFYNDDAIVKQSLKTIIDDAIYKDVFKRYKIKSKDVFEKIFKYVFDNVGKEFSCKNVAEILHLNFRTIVNHLNWLENANIILPISYFEVKGKRILKTNKKYYASDLGVLSSVDGYDTNIGWKLENLVLLVLLSKYDNVYTYKNYNGKQVDFVCEKDKTLVYVQVTKFLIEKNEENSNWEREIGNLESIRDSYEKICICLDNDSQILNSGVKIINVLDWIKNF